MFGFKKVAFLAAALALCAVAPVLAGNTTLFSSSIGDIVFPFSPPTNGGATAGAIDNMVIGATTPQAGNFTTLTSTSAPSGAGIDALFASPPNIGDDTPAEGSFTDLSISGDLNTSGDPPVPTGTGTPSIAAGSTDMAGVVTAGASATSVIITFATQKGAAPFCTVQSQTQLAAFAYTISTTAITITQTATSGNKISYNCIQNS